MHGDANMNLILITIDALRADHLGYAGYERKVSPIIDNIANEGVSFDNAISNAPYTVASLYSLLTSTYPLGKNLYFSISEKITLPEILKKNGYQTCCIHSNPWLSLYKFNKGFDFFMDPLQSRKQGHANTNSNNLLRRMGISKKTTIHGRLIYKTIKIINTLRKRTSYARARAYAKASNINNIALNWLKRRSPDRFFLWLHYMDVHEPYLSPNCFTKDKLRYNDVREVIKTSNIEECYISSEIIRTVCDLYDSEIMYLDKQIGTFLKMLPEYCDMEKTIIILTSDHGQELWDHGHFGHGGEVNHLVKLYDEVLHIPLIMWAKELFVKGKKISTPIGLIDLSPTILNILGIKIPSNFVGKSILHPDYQPMEEFVISQGLQCKDPNRMDIAKHGTKIFSYRNKHYKLIIEEQMNKKELYDIKVDPNETKNVINLYPMLADKFEKKILSCTLA